MVGHGVNGRISDLLHGAIIGIVARCPHDLAVDGSAQFPVPVALETRETSLHGASAEADQQRCGDGVPAVQCVHDRVVPLRD
jgi:hypothetical protein